VISVRNLVFDYPSRRALFGVSFDVAPGSVTALVGPNGAGKTTLLRCLAALEAPTSGSVSVAGLDTLAAPREVHRLLGFLPDFFGLYDDLTVERSLIYAARLRGVPQAEAPAAATRAAARVQLADRMSARAAELSRGMRQRLAIGMTIVHAPRVLLLDEPAAGLDPDARRSLSDLIRTLSADGMTILVSSHILAELEDYSTAMVIVDKGTIGGGGPIARQAHEKQRIRVRFAHEDTRLDSFWTTRGLHPHTGERDTFVEIDASVDARAALLAALVGEGFAVTDFAEAPLTLEETYFAETRSAAGAAP
jgi:ABC-2 type transport system ATP-binding protein